MHVGFASHSYPSTVINISTDYRFIVQSIHFLLLIPNLCLPYIEMMITFSIWVVSLSNHRKVIFVQLIVYAKTNSTAKIPFTSHSWGEIHRCHLNSNHAGTVMWKLYMCFDVTVNKWHVLLWRWITKLFGTRHRVISYVSTCENPTFMKICFPFSYML